jgi:hypothetical protein
VPYIARDIGQSNSQPASHTLITSTREKGYRALRRKTTPQNGYCYQFPSLGIGGCTRFAPRRNSTPWCYHSVFDIGRLKWHDLYVIALIGLMPFPPARFVWSLGKRVRLTRSYYVQTGGDGVAFAYPALARFNLPGLKIQAVTREKRWVRLKSPFPFAYQNYFYTIVTASGRFTFTSMDIPSPARAAGEIAGKSGDGNSKDRG